MQENSKIVRSLLLGLKIVVPVVAVWVLIFKTDEVFLRSIANVLKHLDKDSFLTILLLFGLMLLNWLLESIKWQILLVKFTRLDIFSSIKGVLAGLAVSILSFNRTGDYVGRALYMPTGHRGQAVVAAGAGSLAQLLCTYLIGFIGFAIAYCLFGNPSKLPDLVLIVCLVASLFILIFLYLKMKLLGRLLSKLPLIRKYSYMTDILQNYHKGDLLRVFGLSLARYLVFVVQYYLCLLILGADASFWESFIIISNVYVFSSFIPSISIGEPGIRAIVAWFVANGMGLAPEPLVTGALCLWFVNVGVPALAGSLLWLARKNT